MRFHLYTVLLWLVRGELGESQWGWSLLNRYKIVCMGDFTWKHLFWSKMRFFSCICNLEFPNFHTAWWSFSASIRIIPGLRICHYRDVMKSEMASQITNLAIVYSTVYSGADQRKQSSASLRPLWGEFTGELPAQRASNAENVSIWWHHHGMSRWENHCITPHSHPTPEKEVQNQSDGLLNWSLNSMSLNDNEIKTPAGN